MIFPRNVANKLRSAGKTNNVDRLMFLVFIIFVVDVFIFFEVDAIFDAMHLPTWLLIVLMVLLNLFVLVILIRIFIVRENDKLVEHDMAKDASLSNYYNIINKDVQDFVDAVPVFSFNNGSTGVFLRLTYGATTNVRSRNNARFLTGLYRDALKAHLEVRTFNMPENFSESVECDTMLKGLSGIEDPSLLKAMGSYTSFMLDYCATYSQLQSTIILVRTRSAYQLDSLAIFLRACIASYNTMFTSIRRIEPLNSQRMRMFMSQYYCLEALDLSSLHTKDVSTELLLEYKNLVRVSEINYKNGKRKVLYEQKFKNNSKRMN